MNISRSPNSVVIQPWHVKEDQSNVKSALLPRRLFLALNSEGTSNLFHSFVYLTFKRTKLSQNYLFKRSSEGPEGHDLMRLCYPNAVNKSVNVTIKLWLKKKKNTKIIQAVTDTTQTLENSDKTKWNIINERTNRIQLRSIKVNSLEKFLWGKL